MILLLVEVAKMDIPVPAEMGDANSPASGLFSSIEDASLFTLFSLRRLCQSRKTTAATIRTKPSEPPTAPPMTAPEGPDLPPEPDEDVGEGVDVDRGAVDESKMFRSLKYSY